jgi:hypothetical protein
MGALGNLMQGQERALREQKVGEQSIYSNALLEGQQSQEMENARLTQIQGVLGDKDLEDLTDIERQRLNALGYDGFGEKTDQAIRTDFTGKTYYASEADARKKAPTQPGTWQLRKVGNEYTWFEVKKYGDIVTDKERASYVGAPVVNR